ncbi:hypothetical protein SAMN04487910_4650 [Aquimarina amphilecti]|uniref:Uncharacterized protein n=1 Tax=Aquimarina amphilecti TaxID=1038014 RepID=A0A1H7X6A9_AQUAM|nr:hypothetical protein [Aquimarina amphilecti]SEM29243.1 hypothetical protein SAMN04487910_4650 [Aquimarina amphilecti]
MKKILLGILIIMHFECVGQNKEKVANKENHYIDTTKISNQIKTDYLRTLKELKLNTDSSKSYETVKNSIQQQKTASKELSTDTLSSLFTLSLLNRIIPFWEDTEWSFEGHTSIPKRGKIACGYFVSTTLKHAGVNLNRYKLAQQSPINEAKTLALKTEIIKVAENSMAQNISKIRSSLNDGIHFIGFDASHVGYILKIKGQLYLIHSNYIDSKGVEIEKIENSEVFASYSIYYITELSTNKHLLKSWVHEREIPIITTK